MVYWSPGQGYGSQTYNENYYNQQQSGGENMAWAGVAGAGVAAASGAAQMYFQHLENKKAWHRQRKILENQLRWRAEDATRAMEATGIHRLALLGVSPASGPTVGGLSGLAEGGATAGELIEGAMARKFYGTKTEEEKQIAKIAVSQEREKERGIWLDNQLKSIEVARQLQSQNPSAGFVNPTGDAVIDSLNQQGQANAAMKSLPGIEYQNKQIIPMGAMGVEKGMQAFEKLKMDSEGYVYFLPADSQDIEENAYLKTIYYARQGKRWAIGAIGQNMKKYKNIIQSVFPAPPGQTYVFRKASGQFQLVPISQFQDEIRQKYKAKHEKARHRPGKEYPALRSPRSWQRLKRR